MSKEPNIPLEGIVIRTERDIYVVRTQTHVVQARMGRRCFRNKIRIVPGDRCIVECSPYDVQRGIIVQRCA
ncbi:MAG: translation initiation factor IF-1 [Pirellulales bacterium]